MLTAYIISMEGDGRGVFVDFPTTAEKLAQRLESANIPLNHFGITMIESEGKSLINLIPADLFTLDDLQYIGAKLSDMSREQRDTLHAVLECGFGDDDKHRVFDAIQNLRCFTLDDEIVSAKQYGQSYLKARLETCGNVPEQLSASSDVEAKNLAMLFHEMQEYLDFDAWGKEMAEMGDKYISSVGLLHVDWDEYSTCEDLTVPEEYRLYLTGAEKPSVLARLETEKANVAETPPHEQTARKAPER